MSVPRQLFLRSLEWLRSPESEHREEDVAKAGLECAVRKVRALPRLMMLAQVSGADRKDVTKALEGCDHSLVNLIALAVRKRPAISDDELATCFSLLNAYHRAHPESSRVGA